MSGAPGSHPIGTGIGAAAGGVAGGAAGAAAAGAAIGSAAGPAGTAIGVAAGALIGGLAGKGVAERVNPTEEDAYWQQHHNEQWFAKDRSYDDYRDAYRIGYEGYSKYGHEGRSFDDYESELRQDFDQRRGTSNLPWEDARNAANAAWQKLSGNYHRLIGYGVEDQTGNGIGRVHNLWIDESGQPLFLGVKTGWIFGKNHVVPVSTAEVNDRKEVVRLPFNEQVIKDAPVFDESADIESDEQQRIFAHYGINRSSGNAIQSGTQVPQRSEGRSQSSVRTDEERTVQLKEEELRVGKREVEAGGIRLRKIVRTERVNQPVDLKREEIVIERVPATGEQVPGDASFQDEDIYIPLRREEAVVQKQARVREQVRVGKKTETEHQNVSEELHKEELEVEHEEEHTPTRR